MNKDLSVSLLLPAASVGCGCCCCCCSFPKILEMDSFFVTWISCIFSLVSLLKEIIKNLDKRGNFEEADDQSVGGTAT